MFEKTKINVKEAEEVPFSKKRKHVFWQRSSFSGKIVMLKNRGLSRPRFVYFRPFYVTNHLQIEKALMLCLVFELWAKGW